MSPTFATCASPPTSYLQGAADRGSRTGHRLPTGRCPARGSVARRHSPGGVGRCPSPAREPASFGLCRSYVLGRSEGECRRWRRRTAAQAVVQSLQLRPGSLPVMASGRDASPLVEPRHGTSRKPLLMGLVGRNAAERPGPIASPTVTLTTEMPASSCVGRTPPGNRGSGKGRTDPLPRVTAEDRTRFAQLQSGMSAEPARRQMISRRRLAVRSSRCDANLGQCAVQQRRR